MRVEASSNTAYRSAHHTAHPPHLCSRSPNPFKVYPRIFAELTQGTAKRTAASHSLSWGNRAQDTGDIAKTKRFSLELSTANIS